MSKSSTIAKNTLLLYTRMLFSLVVSLFTSRIILNTLGVEDYGINNVVGGVVSMFTFLNSSMSATVQRFLSFEIGREDKQRLNKVFNTSLIIHIGLAVIFFLLIETIGLWFLYNKLNIPPNRLSAASWVLHFSALSTLMSVLSVPYRALIISREKMSLFAKLSILEISLRLVIVYMLVMFNYDKLKIFSLLSFIVSTMITLLYANISRKSYSETKFRWEWDSALFKEIYSFAGWNLIGVTSGLAKTQGVNIVLNLFFGSILNASRGIAVQVNHAIDNFITNFIVAINPQITKSYAAGDSIYLMKLVENGSRYSFYLLILLSYPILFETEIILKLWLKIVPEYTVVFVRLVLTLSIIEVLSKTLIQLMFSTGRIRNYQIAVGVVTLLNLPFTYIAFKLGYPPQTTFYISIFLAIVALIIRMIMLRKMVEFSIRNYMKNVVFNVFFVSFVSFFIPFLVLNEMDSGVQRLIIVSVVSVVSVTTSIYFLGLSNEERKLVIRNISKVLIHNNKNK